MKLKDWQERQLARDPEYAQALAEIDYAQQVADAIVGERIRLGLTQEELAARAGTTQARISELEHGAGNPTMDTMERVFAALRVAASASAAAPNLLAVKAAAFGLRPAINGTIVVSAGTDAFTTGVYGISVDAGFFLPLQVGQGTFGGTQVTAVDAQVGATDANSALAVAA